jgi:tetratricopeptide (TPR) repeat protein
VRLLLLILALCAAAAPLQAQKGKKAPKRPRFDAGADTNSWGAYYYHGLARIDKHPEEAEAAFYWAARLDPVRSEPLYGRWIAFWASDVDKLARYMLGQRFIVESKDVVAIDSLLDAALLRDPFLHRTLERTLWDKLYEEATGKIAMEWNRADPYTRGWLSYTQGEVGRAAVSFREVLKKKPDNTQARIYLAKALYLMEEYDSAAVELGRVLDEMRKKDQKKLVYFYQSKAHMEYTVGMVHARAGQWAKAKEAFGRALSEDLSFSMAHSRLAEVALVAGDTTESLHEHELAVELRGDDPFLRFVYGAALLQVRKHREAAEHFRKTVELEPHFAWAYFNLALSLDMGGQYPDAVTNYKAFLARAPRAMVEQVTLANDRIKELDGMPALTVGGSR